MMFEDNNIVDRAKAFALAFHSGQKYGDEPYAVHLAEVEEVLMRNGFVSDEDRAVAWLHDVVEDTLATDDDIEQRFGPDVASAVRACTGVGHNRKSRVASILAKLVEYPRACRYKAADRIANLRRVAKEGNIRLAKMYLAERFAFERVVQPNCPKWMRDALTGAYEGVSDMIRTSDGSYDWSTQDAAIDKFAGKLKEKLRRSAVKRGHGWIDPGDVTQERFVQLLRAHVDKGDPVDVGLLAMMMEHHGMSTK